MAQFFPFSAVPKFSFAATLDASSVPAGSVSVETFTVNGLAVGDFVLAQAPALEATLAIVGAKVTAANTLELKIWNFSAGAVNPASQTINVLVLGNS